jgi:hypothetical protein
MGDLVPIADYARGTHVHGAPSPWLRPDPGDWDPCTGCLVRGACREVRECHDEAGAPGRDAVPDVTWADGSPLPGVKLRPVEPPDIVA